jgi:hypothetical protein
LFRSFRLFRILFLVSHIANLMPLPLGGWPRLVKVAPPKGGTPNSRAVLR